MRILMDFSPVRTMGPRVYLRGLLSGLSTLDSANEYLICVAPELVQDIGLDLPRNFHLTGVRLASVPVWRVAWEQTFLPFLVSNWRADIILVPFGIAPLFASVPALVAVRDPAPYLGLNYIDSWQGKVGMFIRRVLLRASCRKAELVYFPSWSAAELLGSAVGVPDEKRRVIYHGTDHSLWSARLDSRATLTKYGIGQRPFVLFVSQLYRQKRAETLIEAFGYWTGRGRADKHMLVFAGEASDRMFYESLRQKVRHLGITDRTLFLGRVPRQDLPALYQSASIFVLPSSLETFGQPYVEAMASGVPTICADTSVAREICGDAAIYFPVGDSIALAKAIQAVIDEPASKREEMTNRGLERSRRYSWDREARETLELIYEAVRSWKTNGN